MPKISIIIPVYNVQDYLAMCLDSVCYQSMKDIEIICVNDGSTDNSLAVLHAYKRRDKRIIIIDKENEGSGVARNTGLKIARGEYVYFVDGDDWLEQDVLLKASKKADETNADIVIFGGSSCYVKDNGKFNKNSGGYSAEKLPKKYLNKVFSAEDIKKDIFKFPSTAWTKLYNRQFLIANNILFQEIKVGQDQLPFFHSMITAERIALLPENLYCYRKNRKGAVTAVKKKKNFSPIYVFYAVEDLLKKLDKIDDYQKVFVNRYFSKATSWLGKFQDDIKEEYFEEYMKLLVHIKQDYPFGWWVKFNPKISDGYWKLKFKRFAAKKL